MKLRYLFASALLASSSSAFAQLTPVSVTGTHLYTNDASIIADGIIPAEKEIFVGSTKVSWVGIFGNNPKFTLDFGSSFLINDILASVDNNDRYRIDYSLNGTSFFELVTIQSNYGEIPSSPGGMDTFSSSLLSPEYVAALDFSPVTARYLRISASGGDALYAIGELQAFGSPVPEPSTYGMIGAAGLVGLIALKRRKRAAK